MPKVIQRVGDWYTRETFEAHNRSGSERSKGDIMAVDVLASSTEATSVEPGGSESGFGNMIAPATANLNRLFGVLLDDTLGDNELGTFGYRGVFLVSCAAGDTFDAGELGVPADGVYTLAEAASGGIPVALLLENAEASVANKLAIFNGEAFHNTGPVA